MTEYNVLFLNFKVNNSKCSEEVTLEMTLAYSHH